MSWIVLVCGVVLVVAWIITRNVKGAGLGLAVLPWRCAGCWPKRVQWEETTTTIGLIVRSGGGRAP